MAQAISTQINLSRDAIRQNITDYVQTYLELENIDLTKSSFLSFLINIISTLTANLLFYQISTYREFFLTKAQLPESILNLSAFLGYSPSDASYSTTNVLVKFPLTFQDASATFTLPEGFKFYADNRIEFLTYYTTSVTVLNNTSVSVALVEGTKTYNLPVSISGGFCSVVFPVRQYKVTQQEFQVAGDTPLYQFVTLDVPIPGKVSSLTVEIRDPDETSFSLWTEFNSMYLMSITDNGYIVRKTDEGRRLYFGNGLVGVQPTPGCTVRVTVVETEGADGNVITGSVKTGDRIYTTTVSGATQIVNYTVTNPSPAANGEDEESTEETRQNAIAGLTTLGRLVTEDDYKNIDVVITDSPLASSALPILKRSDLKANEVQIFTILQYSGGIVPTRNAVHSVLVDTTYIPRGTIITVGDDQYYTLFDMTIDPNNLVTNYHYIMYEIEQTPVLVTNYSSAYDLYSDKLEILKQDDTAVFNLYYHSTESDPDLATCQLEILSTGGTYDMINDSTASCFTYIFDPYTDLPEDEETFYFTISNTSTTIAKYSAKFVFRKSLSDFMMSNTVTDSTSSIIYDIPVIKKSYYDGISQRDFENQVLQIMMTSMDFSSYKMLTDFINMKFTNTTGDLQNMGYNKTIRTSVIDIRISPPSTPSLNDRYIIGRRPTGAWADYSGYVTQCSDATALTWFFISPTTDDIVLVQSSNTKYIYTGEKWIVIPTYQIPLELEIEVFKEPTYPDTMDVLAEDVKATLLEEFATRFGINTNLYHSEIIDVVQGVSGVDHCAVKRPGTNIVFNFQLDDLTETQLLEYGPEYVYFDSDSITIRVY